MGLNGGVCVVWSLVSSSVQLLLSPSARIQAAWFEILNPSCPKKRSFLGLTIMIPYIVPKRLVHGWDNLRIFLVGLKPS